MCLCSCHSSILGSVAILARRREPLPGRACDDRASTATRDTCHTCVDVLGFNYMLFHAARKPVRRSCLLSDHPRSELFPSTSDRSELRHGGQSYCTVGATSRRSELLHGRSYGTPVGRHTPQPAPCVLQPLLHFIYADYFLMRDCFLRRAGAAWALLPVSVRFSFSLGPGGRSVLNCACINTSCVYVSQAQQRNLYYRVQCREHASVAPSDLESSNRVSDAHHLSSVGILSCLLLGSFLLGFESLRLLPLSFFLVLLELGCCGCSPGGLHSCLAGRQRQGRKHLRRRRRRLELVPRLQHGQRLPNRRGRLSRRPLRLLGPR